MTTAIVMMAILLVAVLYTFAAALTFALLLRALAAIIEDPTDREIGAFCISVFWPAAPAIVIVAWICLVIPVRQARRVLRWIHRPKVPCARVVTRTGSGGLAGVSRARS